MEQDKHDKYVAFFTRGTNFKQMADIVNKKDKNALSLRLIDHFLSRFTEVSYYYDNALVSPSQDYKRQLEVLTKVRFDPVRRGPRFEFRIDNERAIDTTIAQLNFFTWAIKSGVLDFIKTNREQIAQSAAATLRTKREQNCEEE